MNSFFKLIMIIAGALLLFTLVKGFLTGEIGSKTTVGEITSGIKDNGNKVIENVKETVKDGYDIISYDIEDGYDDLSESAEDTYDDIKENI